MRDNILLNIDSIVIDFLHNHKIENEKEIQKKRNIKLAVNEGIVTSLIGGNGSGKTTLFNVISGFLKPDKGKIEFKNNGKLKIISTLSPFKIVRLGIGRMFQDNHIFHDMTVLENMLIADESRFGENPFEPFLFYKKNIEIEKKREKEVEEKLTLLFGNESEIRKKLHDKAGSLSHGQQRLLGLARLLMGNYKLLLLDEPTSGVSPQIVDEIKKLFKYFIKEEHKTIFFIEHNIEFVKDVADYCFFMDDGVNKFSGTPKEVLSIPEVRLDYLGV